jgi:hypothetical protein
MTRRIPLDHLTSDQYDQLCERLERAETEADAWAAAESADAAAGSYAMCAEQAEARLRFERRIDRLGAWLCRTRPGTHVAEWLWRACRMW